MGKQKVERPDLTVIAMCPGWVKTGQSCALSHVSESFTGTVPDMGGEAAPLQASVSVGGLLKVFTSATTGDSGKFLRFNGEVIPW